MYVLKEWLKPSNNGTQVLGEVEHPLVGYTGTVILQLE